MEPVRVGIVGTGVISKIYLENAKKFPEIEVVAVADILQERAQERADEFGVPKALPVDELIADPDVELVLNLTIPAAHAGIALQTIAAGKSAFGEKPLATNREDGQRILDAAKAAGQLVGCAPDTFLGGGLQTVRSVIDAGTIGEPVGVNCYFGSPGPEKWHPDPGFFFQPGAGPILDMGPYYLTSLVTLLGPMKRVMAMGRKPSTERTIGQGPKAGQAIPVDVDTFISASIEMESGVIAHLLASWDIPGSDMPKFEIYGTEATVSAFDPNTFGGPIKLGRPGKPHGTAWEDVALQFANTTNSRGLGLADTAVAMRTGRPHRASGELANHVLDGLLAILESAESGQSVALRTRAERPALLPAGLPDWTVGE